MTNKSRRKFLQTHRYCCLCGGHKIADTIEHAPPSVFFFKKHAPNAMNWVPACKRCNTGTSHLDAIAAFYSLMSYNFLHQEAHHDSWERIAQSMANNHPDVLRLVSFDSLANPETTLLRINGNWSHLNVVTCDKCFFEDYLAPWCAKQACALYWRHSKDVYDKHLCVSENTRIGVVISDPPTSVFGESLASQIGKHLPSYGELNRSKGFASDQLKYRFGYSDRYSAFVMIFHDSWEAFVVMAHNEDVTIPVEANIFTTNPQKGIHQI